MSEENVEVVRRVAELVEEGKQQSPTPAARGFEGGAEGRDADSAPSRPSRD